MRHLETVESGRGLIHMRDGLREIVYEIIVLNNAILNN